jgi:hypothetical protein
MMSVMAVMGSLFEIRARWPLHNQGWPGRKPAGAGKPAC